MKLFLVVIALAVIPSAALAATYQYVTFTGDLMMVTAPNAETAIMVAPNRAPTSGVLLVESPTDAVPSHMDVPIDPTPPVTP